MTSKTARKRSPLVVVLLADMVLEVAVGAALLLWHDEIREWLSLGAATIPLGGVFLATAPIIALILVGGTPARLVRWLAWGNIAGGLAGWVLMAAGWNHIEPVGGWLGAATLDTFILLGALQLLAVTRRD